MSALALRLAGDRPRMIAPVGLPAGLVEQVRAHKPDIRAGH